MKIKLGTRGSDLAMTQSRWVAAQLADAGIAAELVVISTSGDRSKAPSFGAIGPQGVFVREIEIAMVEKEIDVAVHSYKDLPTASPDGLVIAAVPKRRDPADWLIVHKVEREPRKRGQSPWGQSPWGQSNGEPDVLQPGARVGTASARRQAWLRHLRPDLVVESLRGNVPTRLKRVADGDFDATLLAGAGIERLTEVSDVLDDSLERIDRLRLDPHAFVPAPAQGALAVQCREADANVREALATLDDEATRTAVDIERQALALVEGGCDTAFGAFAESCDDGFDLSIMLERDGAVCGMRVTGSADGLAARTIALMDTRFEGDA